MADDDDELERNINEAKAKMMENQMPETDGTVVMSCAHI